MGNFEELDLDILLDSIKQLIFSEKAREDDKKTNQVP